MCRRPLTVAWMCFSTETNDRDLALQCALIRRRMRFLVRGFADHADLVEIGLEETFLGKRVERFAYSRIVIWGPDKNVQVHPFAAFFFVGLGDNDEDHRLIKIVVVVRTAGHNRDLLLHRSGFESLEPLFGGAE